MTATLRGVLSQIADERNRAFFSRFVAPSEDGLLLGAWREGALVGYACLYGASPR
jgi:hypothetical protein